jgi:hypothetical protein
MAQNTIELEWTEIKGREAMQSSYNRSQSLSAVTFGQTDQTELTVRRIS